MTVTSTLRLPSELSSQLSSLRLLWSRWPGTQDPAPEIYIRPPRRSDLQAVYDIHSDPRVHLYNPNGPDTWEGSQRRLSGWLEDWHRDGIGYMVVVQQQGYHERVIGFTGLRKFPLPNVSVPDPSPLLTAQGSKYVQGGKEQILNVYYRFSAEVHGKVVASNCVRLAILYALLRFPSYQVAIFTPTPNVDSRKLAEKLGFTHLRDAEWTGIPHTDYRLLDDQRATFISSSQTSTTLPILIEPLSLSDTAEQGKNMLDAFSAQFLTMFPDIPFGGSWSEQDLVEAVNFQIQRMVTLIDEEALGLGVRARSLKSLITGAVLGLMVWDLPAPPPPEEKYAHLSFADRDALHATIKKTRVDSVFPSGGSIKLWKRFKDLMVQTCKETLGDLPHYELRLFCFTPETRGKGIGQTVLKWCIYSQERTPWYLDATFVAIDFYKRFGFVPTESDEIQLLTDERLQLLNNGNLSNEDKYKLNIRLRPMLYTPPKDQ